MIANEIVNNDCQIELKRQVICSMRVLCNMVSPVMVRFTL